MKLFKKKYIIWSSITLNVLLIALLGTAFLKTRNGDESKLPQNEKNQYYDKIVQANYSLLQNNYSEALEVYHELEAQPYNDKQWAGLAKAFIASQDKYRNSIDSLRKVVGFLYSINKEKELAMDSLMFVVQEEQCTFDSLYKESLLKENRLREAFSTQVQLSQEIEELKNAYAKMEFDNEDGQHVKYFGEIKAGKANGYGIAFFESKGIYAGYWKDNIRHGKGKYIWANGDTYEGNFVNGKREGYGVYTFASKEKYVGEWDHDVRDGHGTVYAKNGDVLLDGNWDNDHFIRKQKSQRK